MWWMISAHLAGSPPGFEFDAHCSFNDIDVDEEFIEFIEDTLIIDDNRAVSKPD